MEEQCEKKKKIRIQSLLTGNAYSLFYKCVFIKPKVYSTTTMPSLKFRLSKCAFILTLRKKLHAYCT